MAVWNGGSSGIGVKSLPQSRPRAATCRLQWVLKSHVLWDSPEALHRYQNVTFMEELT